MRKMFLEYGDWSEFRLYFYMPRALFNQQQNQNIWLKETLHYIKLIAKERKLPLNTNLGMAGATEEEYPYEITVLGDLDCFVSEL